MWHGSSRKTAQKKRSRCGVNHSESDDEKEGKEGKTELTQEHQACVISLFIRPVLSPPTPFFTVLQSVKWHLYSKQMMVVLHSYCMCVCERERRGWGADAPNQSKRGKRRGIKRDMHSDTWDRKKQVEIQGGWKKREQEIHCISFFFFNLCGTHCWSSAIK